MKKLLAVIVMLCVLFVVGCGSTPKPAPPPPPATSQAAPPVKNETPATLGVTVAQFKEAYNSEMQKRSANPQLITDGGPAGNGILAFMVSEDPNVKIIGRYAVADNKVTDIVFTFDDFKNSSTITPKDIAAWTAAIVRATSPKLKDTDINAVVSKITGGDSWLTRKDGVCYTVSFENKKTPWLQITVRAEK